MTRAEAIDTAIVEANWSNDDAARALWGQGYVVTGRTISNYRKAVYDAPERFVKLLAKATKRPLSFFSGKVESSATPNRAK